jgi:hypothetical protein
MANADGGFILLGVKDRKQQVLSPVSCSGIHVAGDGQLVAACGLFWLVLL